MKIRIDGVKGLNLAQFIGKRLVLRGSDIETGKYYEMSLDVFDKNTTYLDINEADAPVSKKPKKRGQQPEM